MPTFYPCILKEKSKTCWDILPDNVYLNFIVGNLISIKFENIINEFMLKGLHAGFKMMSEWLNQS